MLHSPETENTLPQGSVPPHLVFIADRSAKPVRKVPQGKSRLAAIAPLLCLHLARGNCIT